VLLDDPLPQLLSPMSTSSKGADESTTGVEPGEITLSDLPAAPSTVNPISSNVKLSESVQLDKKKKVPASTGKSPAGEKENLK